MASTIWLRSTGEILIDDGRKVFLCEVCPCDESSPGVFLCLCPVMPNKLCLVSERGQMTLYYNAFTNDYRGEVVACIPRFRKTTARVYCLNTEFGLVPYLNVNGQDTRIPTFPTLPCTPNLDVVIVPEHSSIAYHLYDSGEEDCPPQPHFFECPPWPDVPLVLFIFCAEVLYWFNGATYNTLVTGTVFSQIPLYIRNGFCRYVNYGLSLQGPAWILEIPISDGTGNYGTATFEWIGNEDIWNGMLLRYSSSGTPLYRNNGVEYIEVTSGSAYIIVDGSCETDITCDEIRYPEELLITLHSDCPLLDGQQFTMTGNITGGTPDRLSYSVNGYVKLYEGGTEADLYASFVFENGGLGGTPLDEYIVFLDFTTRPDLGFNPSGQGVVEQASFTCNPLLFESEEVDIAGAIGGAIDPGSDPTHPIWTTCGFTIKMSFTVEGV